MSERKFDWRTPVIAIDFDGCLCKDEWPDIGPPNWEVINEAKRLREGGACLILWSCRGGDNLDRAVEACREWGLEFDAINENPEFRIALFGDNDCRKIGADEYWDDKAVYMGTPGAFRTIRGSTVQTRPNIDNRKFIDEALRPEIARLQSLQQTDSYQRDWPTFLLQECVERMELLMATLEERGPTVE